MKPTDMKGPIAWMAGNSVAANLIMLLCLIGGAFFAMTIKKEVFPEFELDLVTVAVVYPGASPAEVEKGIVLAIEERVRGIEGIKKVFSISREGNAVVTIELFTGEDRSRIYQDIKQEVDRITTFPEESEKPVITLAAQKREVLDLMLYGDQNEAVLSAAAEKLRDALLADPSIDQVDIEGTRNPEIHIEVSRESLRRYGLTIRQIAQKIKSAALESPGGGIDTAQGEVLVRVAERRERGTEFGAIPVVVTPAGTQVRLEEIAKVRDDFEETDLYTQYNGKPAVNLEVYRIGDQTPQEVADAGRRVIAAITPDLPPGIAVEVMDDRSEVYTQRMDLLLNNAYFGMALVFLLLGLFLEARLAFWVTLGIPISFLGGFLFLPALGVTINLISMFAFIIALGIVVDDAIVVGEIIYEKRQRGVPPLQAAIEGAREVGTAVIFAVLTNIVTFAPLIFIPGVSGKIFGQIPFVVITVFTISLIEALFVLPSHLSHPPARRGFIEGKVHAMQQRFSEGFTALVRRRYHPFLERILHFRYITIAAGIALLIVSLGFVASGRLGFILMPKIEADYAAVTVTLPFGVPVERSLAVNDRLLAAARAVGDENGGKALVRGLYTIIGRAQNGVPGPHTIEVRAYLTDAEVRPLSTTAFTKLWRERVGPIQGAEMVLFEADRGGPGSGAAIALELMHRDNAVVEAAAKDLAAMLAEIPLVKDIDDGFADGKVQLDFTVLPAGESMGLTASEVAAQVRGAYYGEQALRQQRGRNEMKVMVRLPEKERVSEYDLENLILRNAKGREMPLAEAVKITRGRSYTKLEHKDGYRVGIVSANVEPHEKTSLVKRKVVEELMPRLQGRHPGLSYSFTGRQQDIAESMTALYQGFFLALLMIYALLAIPFRSYSQPLIIMVSIPFGIIGAIIGHLLMGYTLSVNSMMGVVALSGVVVNDSLVLIEYANRLRTEEKASPFTAVLESATRRFRPILLTTLTTFGGLAPMIFEQSRQAKFMIPMAISLGFGILFATLITLALIPCLYLVIEDVKGLFGKAATSP